MVLHQDVLFLATAGSCWYSPLVIKYTPSHAPLVADGSGAMKDLRCLFSASLALLALFIDEYAAIVNVVQGQYKDDSNSSRPGR